MGNYEVYKWIGLGFNVLTFCWVTEPSITAFRHATTTVCLKCCCYTDTLQNHEFCFERVILSILQVAINLLTPTGHVMHQQFNIQQLYVLPTLYLCVLYLSENKQRLVPLTA